MVDTAQFVPVENPYASPARYGLLRSANIIVPEDLHWGRGIGWPSDPCKGLGAAVDPLEIGNATLTPPGDDDGPLYFHPFVCWEYDQCSTRDNWTDLAAKAARRLARSTSKQIGAEFWTGTLTTSLAASKGWANFHLQDNSNTTKLNSSTATPAVLALGHLQNWAATNYDGSPVMIHAPATVINAFTAQHLVYTEPNGGLLYDALGNIFVPDPGYTGLGPDGSGTATSTPWAYVTGMVSIRLSPIDTDVPGGYIDRINNTRQHWATRVAAFSVDTCRAAIKVDLTKALA